MIIKNFFVVYNNLYFDCQDEIDFLIEKKMILSKVEMNLILNRNKKKSINYLNDFYNVHLNVLNVFVHFVLDNIHYEVLTIINKNSLKLMIDNIFCIDNRLIKINVINLKKCYKRLLKIRNQLDFFNQYYEIFNATDPNDKNFLTKLKENNILLNNSKRRYGEAGCALSHIEIIKQFLNSNEQYCIIIEDDCQLLRRIPQRIENYSNFFNNKIDVLYISDRIKCDKYGKIISGVGTEGYIINRIGGEKILKICYNIDCGIDLRYQSHYPFYYRKNHKSEYHNIILNGFKSNKQYVLHKDDGKSNIDNTYSIF